MTDYLFPPAPVPSLTVRGETAEYPVRRIFCVGRNYAAHAAELGNEVDREAPFYFTKSACHAEASGAALPYPPGPVRVSPVRVRRVGRICCAAMSPTQPGRRLTQRLTTAGHCAVPSCLALVT